LNKYLIFIRAIGNGERVIDITFDDIESYLGSNIYQQMELLSKYGDFEYAIDTLKRVFRVYTSRCQKRIKRLELLTDMELYDNN